jgi:hypothetical protein
MYLIFDIDYILNFKIELSHIIETIVVSPNAEKNCIVS